MIAPGTDEILALWRLDRGEHRRAEVVEAWRYCEQRAASSVEFLQLGASERRRWLYPHVRTRIDIAGLGSLHRDALPDLAIAVGVPADKIAPRPVHCTWDELERWVDGILRQIDAAPRTVADRLVGKALSHPKA